MADDDKLLVLPLGDESKGITQIISNDTARKILEHLADSPMSTSAIAKKLNIPLTTAQYNIEKLIEAGLVKIEKTKYSEKGREVKLYSAAKRYIVLVPEKTPSQAVIDALKKYLVLLPIAAVLSVIAEYVMSMRYAAEQSFNDGERVLMTAGSNATEDALKNAAPVAMPVPEPSLWDQISQSLAYADPLSHIGVWFFMGCLMVIAGIVAIEYLKYRNIGASRSKNK
jgi:predicted transcriptional regulator